MKGRYEDEEVDGAIVSMRNNDFMTCMMHEVG